MIRHLRAIGPALALSLMPLAGVAAELTLLRSFDFPGPSGLGYDARYCGLWVATESPHVVLISPWGDEIMSFEAPLSRVDALEMDGENLVLSDGNGTYLRVDRTGKPLGETYHLPGGLYDTDGLFIDPVTHDIWIADDTAEVLLQVHADGTLGRRIEGADLATALHEPQGITRDPASGNFLVVDDADASDSLFEFDSDGKLLDVIPLAMGGYDAEGITVQPDTGIVFIAYDDGDRISAFRYVPTDSDDRVAPAEEEPGGCVISALRPAALPGALPG